MPFPSPEKVRLWQFSIHCHSHGISLPWYVTPILCHSHGMSLPRYVSTMVCHSHDMSLPWYATNYQGILLSWCVTPVLQKYVYNFFKVIYDLPLLCYVNSSFCHILDTNHIIHLIVLMANIYLKQSQYCMV